MAVTAARRFMPTPIRSRMVSAPNPCARKAPPTIPTLGSSSSTMTRSAPPRLPTTLCSTSRRAPTRRRRIGVGGIARRWSDRTGQHSCVPLLAVGLVFTTSVVVPLENYRYANFVGVCTDFDIKNPAERIKHEDCLHNSQTRTGWDGTSYMGNSALSGVSPPPLPLNPVPYQLGDIRPADILHRANA